MESKAGGRPPRTGQNTASAITPADGRCAEGGSRLLPIAPSAADSGKPTRLQKDTETNGVMESSEQRSVDAPDTFIADGHAHVMNE